MLDGADLDQLSRIGPGDPQFNRAYDVFARGGAALGRALAHVSNTVNPNRIIAFLPSALAEPQAGSAAEAYTSTVRYEVARAFAAGSQDDYLTIRPLPSRPMTSPSLKPEPQPYAYSKA